MEEKQQKPTMLGNLNVDSSVKIQPERTTRFVLNGVNETNEGDLGLLSVEEGNEIAHLLPEGFIPLGSVSITNNKSVIFLGNGIDSIIATVKGNSELVIEVDDRNQQAKLGFSLSRKIDAIFRLRRGCESTIYWVDPVPRKYVIERPDKFQNENGDWNINSFSLFRKILKQPKFKGFTVNSSGGSLPSGSYIFSVQYLDADFNPTEFINSAQPIRIYTDSINSTYRTILGSSSREEAFYSPQGTTKSITVELENLDRDNYPFYRLAISEVNTGSGLISEVKLTNEIPTSINKFTYTGNNFAAIATQEEVSIFNLIINEADNIDQLDNQLILSSVRGSNAELCNLQKFASKIQVDCVTKKVSLVIPTGSNPKNPLSALEGLGYMPGEIYSLGIVYILEENEFSPVFHIPGKSPLIDNSTRFTEGVNIYPMSNDNQATDSVYTDNNTCGNSNYWGLDSQGEVLLNTPIRHHRFPFRSDIGLKLVEKEDFNPDGLETWQLKIEISGSLNIPECPEEDPNCIPEDIADLDDIVYEIVYKLADSVGNPVGDDLTLVDNINYEDWDNDAINDTPPIPGTIKYSSSEPTEFGLVPVTLVETVNGVSRTYTFTNGVVTANNGGSGLVYTVTSIPTEFTIEGASYTTEILGVKFSNIEIPSPESIGDKKVTGYFFVRNERVEEEKTIVDTAIVGPSLIHQNFISHAHIFPELNPGDESRINKNYLYLINPDFKFNGNTYNLFDKIVKQGEYQVEERLKSRVIVQDVFDGTTYNRRRHSSSERDEDGWQLHVKTRQNKVEYHTTDTEEILNEQSIEEVFYLNALASRRIESDSEEPLEYFNLSSDNKIGVIRTQDPVTEDFNNSVSYVALMRTNANPYANFRATRYIKITNNFYDAEEPGNIETKEEFGGDTYVTPLSYVNSIFYREQPRKRRSKSGLFRQILGGVLILAGAAVAIFTFGLGIPIAIAIGSAGVAIGATSFAAGIRQENFNRAYRRLYDEGLRETIIDNLTDTFDEVNPVDDEIQWVADSATLFFETSVNTSLRHGVNKTSDTDFLRSPMLYENGNPIQNGGQIENRVVKSATALDAYMVEKLTYFEPEREKESRAYLGIALPELYVINRDYHTENIQKVYEHLPIEYDCCSDCLEDFPHRIHHSLQSFEEELTDNFGVFLPNDYKDIEGGTGKIVDTFRIQNNLYVVTQHALWHLPQNFQERVTDSIVSFIGTGEYFSIPPRKIVDDEINSAGTSYKWGVFKSRNGVIIVSNNENKIYLFNGNELRPISDQGLSSYFRNNITLKSSKQNSSAPIDNTSSLIGSGFIVAYDTTKERFIITKKDKKINNLPEGDNILCYSNQNVIIFENIDQIIAQQEQEGFNFKRVEDCKLVFEKSVVEVTDQFLYSSGTVPNSTDIIFHIPVSPRFDNTKLIEEIEKWEVSFKNITGWTGNVHTIVPSVGGGRWLASLSRAKTQIYNNDLSGKNILMVNIAYSSLGSYYTTNLFEDFIPEVEQVYKDNYSEFQNLYQEIIGSGGSFYGLNIPVVSQSEANSKTLLQQMLAAVKTSSNQSAISFTLEEFNLLERNPGIFLPEWRNILRPSLLSTNPYIIQNVSGLDQFDVYSVETQASKDVTPSQSPLLEQDLTRIINTFTNNVGNNFEFPFTVNSVNTISKEVRYIEGVEFQPQFEDYSWTLSYSLKSQGWVSWHSYLPDFYLNETERFYSWKHGLNNLWKHNAKGLYQTYYGETKPFIVEFVSNKGATATKIWDSILYQAEAKIYDEESEEFIDVDTTFNKALFYNSYQTSGIQTLVVKTDNADYMMDQIISNEEEIIVDRNERDFTLNNFRDFRKDMSTPMFLNNPKDLQEEYFIDKKVNPDSINLLKDWTELESFRDKYLVVRLIFDTFDNTKLTMFFSMEDIKPSER